MLKLFSNNTPIVNIVSIFLFSILMVSLFLVNSSEVNASGVISVFSSIGYVFLFNYTIKRNEIFNRANNLSTLLISFSIVSWGVFFGYSLYATSHLFLLFALYRTLITYDKPNNLIAWFEVAFLLSISTLISSSSIIYFPFYFLALLIFSQFKIREVLLGVIGFVLPYFSLFCFKWINDFETSFVDVINDVIKIRFPKLFFIQNFNDYWIILCFIIFIIGSLIGLRLIVKKIPREVIKVRRKTYVILVFLLFTLFDYLLSFYSRGEIYFFKLIPCVNFLLLFAILLMNKEWYRRVLFYSVIVTEVILFVSFYFPV